MRPALQHEQRFRYDSFAREEPRDLCLLVRDRECFLDSAHFPWFAEASVRDVYDVELQHGHIVRWPQLNIDLELESLANPEAWPLVWR
jgi:hypothetical protein